MGKTHLHNLIGLAGVDESETEVAKKWAKRFELPMILAAMWLLIDWYAVSKEIITPSSTVISDWVIWLFFIIETLVLSFCVHDPWVYLRNNWVNLLIVLLGIPIIWGVATHAGLLRFLRLLLMFTLVFSVSKTLREVLAQNNLGNTLIVALFVIAFSGILIAGIDPAISGIGEGLWWAWVTVTTVGYGDIVPASWSGKLFGSILILLGIGLFSLLTANFSAFFIAREEQRAYRAELDALVKLDKIEKRLQDMEQELKRINTKSNGVSDNN
jgi:voltage-gated potassium channel